MDITLLSYLCIIVAAVISIGAQIYINLTYNKYSQKSNENGVTGAEAARRILNNNELGDVQVNSVRGNLTDFYDPRNKTVNLSDGVHSHTSIAAVAVASHECGHAIQDKNGYFFLRLRRTMVPFVNIASYLGYFAILIGFAASMIGLIEVGIVMELIILTFQLVTLPVEFNASNRALKQIKELGLLEGKEYKGARKMLVAAALTYVAGAASALLNVLRLVLILMDRRRDD